MVMAMMTAAISQPAAIHMPPSAIQRTLSSNETGDMAVISILPAAILKIKNRGRQKRD
jgi:hypothetical protein